MQSNPTEIEALRVVVTGGAGFIGSNFIRRLLGTQANVSVLNLDLLTYAGNLASLGCIDEDPRYSFVHGSIGDATLVGKLLAEYQPDCIFNFAAESHVDRSIDSPDEFIQTNVVGTASLLRQTLAYWETLEQARRDAFRFLHVSTDEVYGSLGETGKFSEQTRYQPNSPYSASKAASDHLVRAYHETFGLPTAISNCSNNYGPYQFPEKLIPLMTLNAIEGKPLPVYGDGANVRDWLFVTDHCDALIDIWQRGRIGEVYNIGGDAERTNLEVVQTICAVVDELVPNLPHSPCTDLIEYVTDRPGHDRRYAIDATKIQDELGWKPKVDFTEGIRQTVQWYLDHQNWVSVVASDSERDRKGLSVGSTKTASSEYDVDAKPAEYRDGEIHDVVIRELKRFDDPRGWLMELFRSDEIPVANYPVMAYVSETKPGVTRGPHEHAEQADFFTFVGPGEFELWLWDSRPSSPTCGNRYRTIFGTSNPASVIIPPGVVHAYRNISDEQGLVFNLPNRLYAGQNRAEAVDEIRHEDQPDSPFQLGKR